MWRGFSETDGSLLNRKTDDKDRMDFHGFFSHISVNQNSEEKPDPPTADATDAK